MIPPNDFAKFRHVPENICLSVELPISINIIVDLFCSDSGNILYVLYVAAWHANCIRHLGKTWFAPLNGFSPVRDAYANPKIDPNPTPSHVYIYHDWMKVTVVF